MYRKIQFLITGGVLFFVIVSPITAETFQMTDDNGVGAKDLKLVPRVDPGLYKVVEPETEDQDRVMATSTTIESEGNEALDTVLSSPPSEDLKIDKNEDTDNEVEKNVIEKIEPKDNANQVGGLEIPDGDDKAGNSNEGFTPVKSDPQPEIIASFLFLF